MAAKIMYPSRRVLEPYQKFTIQRKPWIKPENATSKELIDQVAKCP